MRLLDRSFTSPVRSWYITALGKVYLEAYASVAWSTQGNNSRGLGEKDVTGFKSPTTSKWKSKRLEIDLLLLRPVP